MYARGTSQGQMQTVDDGTWAKHLRPWRKRMFWKRERTAQKKAIKKAGREVVT